MKRFLYFSFLATVAFGALVLVFFVHSGVYAQEPVTINPTIPGTAPTDNPAGIISNLYQFALMIGGILAFGAIVYGGIKYVAAGGNPSSQSEGKEWIKGALWGLLLLVGASLILNTINRSITSLSFPDLPGVSNFAPREGVAGVGLDNQEVRQRLAAAGITVNSDIRTNLGGMQEATVNEVIQLKQDCGCSIVVTGGTEAGHASGGYSHATGYKADVGVNPALDNYITNNFAYVGNRLSDRSKLYRSPSGGIYARESNHWDILIPPP